MTKKLIVFGANGFIGSRLIKDSSFHDYDVLCISRGSNNNRCDDKNLIWHQADLNVIESWSHYVDRDSVVINLAFSQYESEEAAINSMDRILLELSKRGIKRFIHFSTVGVYGNVAEEIIDEHTSCRPVSRYARIKYSIEKSIENHKINEFDYAIVRPTETFGCGGLALESLCRKLVFNSKIENYLRSSINARRLMHLVPIETIVASTIFLINHPNTFNGNIYIVSNDDDPINNYIDVENILMQGLGLNPYLNRRIEMPSGILQSILYMLSRETLGIKSKYSSEKLKKAGFLNPVSLADSLLIFANHWRLRNITL